jgi:uncharacterized protein YndB with AHSA1/START domain
MNNQPIVMEHLYDAPVSRVWKALTDKNEMKQWYFDISEFKPVAGFRFQFSASQDPNNPYIHLCQVTEVIKEKKLSYSWKYQDFPGESLVTWELTDKGGKTLLTLTHAGLETFITDNPDFARTSFNEGWTHILHTGLKNYLEG